MTGTLRKKLFFYEYGLYGSLRFPAQNDRFNPTSAKKFPSETMFQVDVRIVQSNVLETQQQ